MTFLINNWQWMTGTLIAGLGLLVSYRSYKKKQKETHYLKSGNRSLNIQNSDNIQLGLTYSEAKDLFVDLFKLNFPKFQAIAAAEASKNIENFSKRFAERLNAKQIIIDDDLSTPDFHFNLYKAIEISARFNNDLLHSFLAELLVKRISNDKNDTIKTILSESIISIGKISLNQLKMLTFSFVFLGYWTRLKIKTWQEFNDYIKEYIQPFMDYNYKEIDILHLDYSGCVNIDYGFGRPSLSQIIKNRIPELYPDLKSHQNEQGYIDSITKEKLLDSVNFFAILDNTKLWAIDPTSVGLMLINVYFEIEKGYKLNKIDEYFE